MQYKTLALIAALTEVGLATSALAQAPETTIRITQPGPEQTPDLKVDLINTPQQVETQTEVSRLAGLPAFDIMQKIASGDSCLDREGDALRLKNCHRTTPTRWVNDGGWLRPKTGITVDQTKCLTTDASRRVMLMPCVKPPSSGQQWDMEAKTGWITSRLAKGVCLTAPSSMGPCGLGASQVWRASDQYILQEARNAQKAATSPTTTAPRDIEVTTFTVPILAQSSADGTELCVGGKLMAGAQAELVACNSGDGHNYVTRTFTSGQQPITRFEVFDGASNKPKGLCLDVRGGSAQQGTPVQLYACNTGEGQKWTQTEQIGELIAGKAASRMQSSAGINLCLDAAGGQQKLGTKLIIWACHLKADNQNFRVGMFR